MIRRLAPIVAAVWLSLGAAKSQQPQIIDAYLHSVNNLVVFTVATERHENLTRYDWYYGKRDGDQFFPFLIRTSSVSTKIQKHVVAKKFFFDSNIFSDQDGSIEVFRHQDNTPLSRYIEVRDRGANIRLQYDSQIARQLNERLQISYTDGLNPFYLWEWPEQRRDLFAFSTVDHSPAITVIYEYDRYGFRRQKSSHAIYLTHRDGLKRYDLPNDLKLEAELLKIKLGGPKNQFNTNISLEDPFNAEIGDLRTLTIEDKPFTTVRVHTTTDEDLRSLGLDPSYYHQQRYPSLCELPFIN